MNRGRVYTWQPDCTHPLGGRVRAEVVPLQHLDHRDDGPAGLSGRHVRVRNAGALRKQALPDGPIEVVLLGNATPDHNGDFFFDPAGGGARVEREALPDADACERHVQASRFGEVNTYYHLDRIATYVDELLRQLGAPTLPWVTAVVHAHAAVVEKNGVRDGTRRHGGVRPFQGGHYRLPGHRLNHPELDPVSPEGEIHLGPGWELLDCGALVESAGVKYRHNASHNAAILYHEYGHHVTRHTADFRRNAMRPPDLQDNRKTSLDEGICDYWSASLLDSPHIWAWHRRHDGETLHRRSLTSPKTMADFDASPDADPHANGTIWAAALWDAQRAMDDARTTDLLLLKALLLWREQISHGKDLCSDDFDRGPESFGALLALLLRADEELFGSRHQAIITQAFSRRGIQREAVVCHHMVSQHRGPPSI
jgi:hypothetical protein